MTVFQPGDVVDIEITNARVDELLEDGGMSVRVASGDYLWLVPADDVAVTRRAPQPQCGDVWRLADGTLRQIHMAHGILYATEPHSGKGGAPSGLDFTGATRVYPYQLATGGGMVIGAEQVAPAVRRRFRDRDYEIWTETAPGSGQYQCPGSGKELDVIAQNYGPLVDLATVPADAEAVR
jgi:hypothetical protein